LLVREVAGEAVGVVLVDYRRLGISPVAVPAGEERKEAKVLGAALTEPALPAGVPEPRDADSLTDDKAMGALSDLLDDADDLVSGNHPGALGGQVPLDEVEIGAANGTGCDRNGDLSWPGRRLGPLEEPEGPRLDRPRAL
jgi:hypothetical protein